MRRYELFRTYREIYAPFKSDALCKEHQAISSRKRVLLPDLLDDWLVP